MFRIARFFALFLLFRITGLQKTNLFLYDLVGGLPVREVDLVLQHLLLGEAVLVLGQHGVQVRLVQARLHAR